MASMQRAARQEGSTRTPRSAYSMASSIGVGIDVTSNTRLARQSRARRVQARPHSGSDCTTLRKAPRAGARLSGSRARKKSYESRKAS